MFSEKFREGKISVKIKIEFKENGRIGKAESNVEEIKLSFEGVFLYYGERRGTARKKEESE